MSHIPFKFLCARDPQFSKQQSPTVCNSCYLFTDLYSMDARVWLSVPGVKHWASCMVYQSSTNEHAQTLRVGWCFTNRASLMLHVTTGLLSTLTIVYNRKVHFNNLAAYWSDNQNFFKYMIYDYNYEYSWSEYKYSTLDYEFLLLRVLVCLLI